MSTSPFTSDNDLSIKRRAQHQGPSPEFIKNLFGSISQNYDRANDLMTFGVARRWRQALVNWSEAKPGDSVLDCATGTGDLAIAFKKTVGLKGQVIGTDFCAEMLELAPKKAQALGLDISFSLADTTELPYSSQSFDITSIAFGIRNVEYPKKALTEMARVTKSGGKVMILETGNHQLPVIGPFIQFYFRQIVPLIGGIVTGRKQAYQYLNDSSHQFPGEKKFLELMQSAELFSSTSCRPLLGGASYLYKGVVRH